MVILRRAPALAPARVRLDDRQQAALDSSARVLRVLGGPGTGKSTLAVELVVDAVRQQGLRADSCLVLTSSRSAAAALRQQVTARLGRHVDGVARAHVAGVRLRRAARRGGPARRPTAAPAQRPGAGRHPARPARRARLRRGGGAGVARGAPRGPDDPRLPQRAARPAHALGRARAGARRPGAARRRARPARVGGGGARAAGVRPGHLVHPARVLRPRVGAHGRRRAARRRPVGPRPPPRAHPSRRRRRGPGADLRRGPAARASSPVPGGHGSSSSATPTSPSRPSAAPTRGSSPTGGPTSPGQGATRASSAVSSTCSTTATGARPSSSTARTGSGAAMAGVADRVSRRIGALGGGEQRRMTPATDDPARGTVEVALLRSAAQETAHVAALLRRAHLVEGVPWTDMAVVVRGSGRADTMRRLLGQAGVPVEAGSAETPVRDESAVRPLLHLLEESIAIARAEHRGETHTIDPVRAADLVLSPVGGSDTVGLRRLRRLLRQDELASGGGRSSDELLAELLQSPPRARMLGSTARPAERIATALAAGAAAARVDDDGRWARGVTAESVLWAIWQGAGVAEGWRRQALSGGTSGERADRDLDAVLALFDAAGAFVDRLPTAGPDTFLEHIQGQDVPGDTLARRRPVGRPRRAADAADRCRPTVAHRRRRRRPGGRLARPAPARLGPRLRGPRRRRGPAAARLPRRPGRGALRRDAPLPRRRHPGHRATARHRGRQRGRAALGLPRPRRPAGDDPPRRRGAPALRGRPHDDPAGARRRAAPRGGEPRSRRRRAGPQPARRGGA